MRKLEKEELFPYVRGCLRMAVDASGRMRCFRFTEKQLAEYNKSDIYSVRAALNSGIKLDFYTDSSSVELSWELFTPILNQWASGDPAGGPLHFYPQGTPGPEALQRFLAQ